MNSAQEFKEHQHQVWQRLQEVSPHTLPHFRAPYPTPWRVDDNEQTYCREIFAAISTALSLAVSRYHVDADIRSFLKLAKREQEILQMARHTPYRQGCIRPDFVYRADGEILVSEINGRFAFNGYMISLAFERLHQPLARAPSAGFALFQKMLTERLKEFPRVVVVKGLEEGGDIFGIRSFAKDFAVVSPARAESEVRADDFVILELKQREIGALTDAFLIGMIDRGSYLNDLRTIFIGHDKRFLALISAGLLDPHLPPHAMRLLRRCLIPTYVPELASAEIIRSARDERDAWILKPIRSGKGQGILLGQQTPRDIWCSALQSDGYVLQNFIRQPKFELNFLNAEEQLSTVPMHVVGLIPGMDGVCFGPGIYRASSEKIVNVFSGGHILGQQTS